MRKSKLHVLSVLFIGIFGITLTGFAQQAEDSSLREAYLSPPESIAEEVMMPRHKNVSLDDDDLAPNGEYFYNTIDQAEMTPLENYAKSYYNLAGLQVDRQANRNRRMTTHTTAGIELINAHNGEKHEIETPDDVLISNVTWSPDGSRLAYFAHSKDATHIYIANVENGSSERITEEPVLATYVTSIEWSGNGNHIFTVLLPEERKDEPVEPATPESFQVRKTTTDENRLRTYQTLLKNQHQANLLEYYTTGQLARIDVQENETQGIGQPSMIRSIDPAPDGEHIIVRTVQKPFSYIVPYYSFGWSENILDMNGDVLAELRTSEIRAGIPDHEEIEDYNRDDIKWRPDGKGLSFVLTPEEEEEEESEDNGDDQDEEENEEEAEEEDEEEVYKVVQWMPPFGDDDMNVLYETDKEIRAVNYNDDADIFFVWGDQGSKEHVYAVFAEETDTTYTIYKHDNDDFYEDPGNILRAPGEMGETVIRTTNDDSKVYLRGREFSENYTEEAPRPFLDRVDIRSGEKERLFQSSADVYEEITALLNDGAEEIVLERQSPEMYPDFWLHEISSGDRTKLTENIDYNEAVTQTQRERFKVERSDGFEFWVEVLLPNNWNGEPLPGLIWHYPSEYDDQEDYDEGMRYYNKNDFPGVYRRSPDILVKEGYAIVKADWPIVAERGSSNDGFVWSIVQNSTVVIDSVANRGYIDRDRMAIGGHSYGAFGTANAMIHTSFFKAGIAGDGNYNRTLTPMGFQREPRDLWRGLSRYLEMSPIFWADRVDGALLMYHGEEDQNVGTWPVHSKRMFHALNGMGKTAAMYMYPHEAHGPAAEETMLDLWTRWSNWLDHYVKNEGDHVPESELGSGTDDGNRITSSN